MELRSLSKSYGDLAVLEAISFEVPSGTRVGIIGASGSGKSTLLRLIAGLETPTRGEVLVDGLSVTGPGRERALMFQSGGLYPWLTLRDNVAFALEAAGLKRAAARERAETWLSRVGLDGFEGYFPEKVSGGMQSRTALARALSTEPELLLLDEPFGALDAITRMKLQETALEVIRTTRATMLLVTHDVDEALYLTERLLVLSPHPGRLVAQHDVPRLEHAERADPRLADLRRTLLAELGLVSSKSSTQAITQAQIPEVLA
ncbi:ABC transporter ATP-binding protein [soil metagenome]